MEKRVKTVLLLRHAKSAWGDARLTDHDRPLSRRGERAALAMARHITKKLPRPDLILCSTAVRARQTLAPLVPLLKSPAPPIALEKGLYLATEDALLERLRAVPDDVGTVLMIGHNEGLWHFAVELAGDGKAAQLAALRAKLPTGALVVLSAPIEHWQGLAPAGTTLAAFVRPRELPQD
jgi:phosphohistidine phosphatase